MDLLHDLIGSDGETITTLQMSVRALIIFAYGLVLVRIAGKRTFGKLSAFDILLAVIIGSNLSRTLTASAPFVPTLVATTLLVALHFVLGRLAVHFDWVGPVIKGSPRQIIRDGKLDSEAMRKAELSEGDLDMALRLQGYENLDQIASGYLERSGDISLIAKE